MTKWKTVAICNMNDIIGIILNMVLYPLAYLKDYFSTNWVTKSTFSGTLLPGMTLCYCFGIYILPMKLELEMI